MTKTKRSILLAVLTMMLALALVVGGTYALFTDEVPLTNHLVAGKMDITLIRTNLKTTALDRTTGFLVDEEVTDPKDFSLPTTDNVFGITTETLIVPQCKYVAEMQILNTETPENLVSISHVAYAYWIEIVFNNAEDLDLADQLIISVVTKDTDPTVPTEPIYLSQGLKVGSAAEPIGVLALGDSETFTVSVEFESLPEGLNNTAKGQSLDFDLIVHAVQVTRAP